MVAGPQQISVYSLAADLSVQEIVTLQPQCSPTAASICNEHLTYSSEHEVYCLRVTLETKPKVFTQ